MTAKEKANQLVQKFYFSLPNNGAFEGIYNINQRWEEGKKCALIAVDEIIKSRKDDYQFDDSRYASPSSRNYKHYVPHPMYSTYWEQVKTEIEKL